MRVIIFVIIIMIVVMINFVMLPDWEASTFIPPFLVSKIEQVFKKIHIQLSPLHSKS